MATIKIAIAGFIMRRGISTPQCAWNRQRYHTSTNCVKALVLGDRTIRMKLMGHLKNRMKLMGHHQDEADGIIREIMENVTAWRQNGS